MGKQIVVSSKIDTTEEENKKKLLKYTTMQMNSKNWYIKEGEHKTIQNVYSIHVTS